MQDETLVGGPAESHTAAAGPVSTLGALLVMPAVPLMATAPSEENMHACHGMSTVIIMTHQMSH